MLANDLRGRNITVTAVAPGPVATELFLTGKAEAQVEELRKLPPLERLGQPQDIASIVSFLQVPTATGSMVRSFALMVALVSAFQLLYSFFLLS